jgi:hypothetical protein
MASHVLAHNGRAVEHIKAPITAMARMRRMQGVYLILMTSKKSTKLLSLSYKAKQLLANGGSSASPSLNDHQEIAPQTLKTDFRRS